MDYYILKDVKIIYDNYINILIFEDSNNFLISKDTMETYIYCLESDNKVIPLGKIVYVINKHNRLIKPRKYIKRNNPKVISGKLDRVINKGEKGVYYCYYKIEKLINNF